MPTTSRLQIVVFYANRTWDTFYQDDSVAIKNILDSLTLPGHVFKDRSLLIGEGQRVIAVPGHQITRIELTGDVPTWQYVQDVESVQEVSAETFAMRFDPKVYRLARREAWANADTDQYGFTEVTLSDGGHMIWEVIMRSRTLLDSDVQPYINSLLNAGVLHARKTDDDGVVIVNPSHIVRLAFYPGPPTLPAKSWRVEPGTGG